MSVPFTYVRYARYCSKMYSSHLLPYGGLFFHMSSDKRLSRRALLNNEKPANSLSTLRCLDIQISSRFVSTIFRVTFDVLFPLFLFRHLIPCFSILDVTLEHSPHSARLGRCIQHSYFPALLRAQDSTRGSERKLGSTGLVF